MSNSEENSVLSERLPYLVVEALLNRLDIFDLKTLRLVSNTTKRWVEQPEFLRQFSVVINSEARMIDVLSSNSQVPWNNFTFSKKYKYVSETHIKKFVTKYSESVRALEFNWSQEKNQHQLHILSECQHLTSLKSNQLCFVAMQKWIHLTTFLEKWTHLKHLHVQRFRGTMGSPQKEMKFFEQILKVCCDLRTLTVPQFSYDYQPIGFDYDESFVTHIVSPLISYIGTKRLQSITVPYCGLTDDIFLKLAQACREAGTVLLNVRSTFLKSLPDEHLEILDIIGSLDGVTDTIIRAPLPNVQNICFVNPSFHIDNHGYGVPPLPSLANVEIDFKFSRKSQKSMELFVHRLGKIQRPTVKSLRITYQPGPPVVFPIHISPLDLVSSFVNLRVLHIKDWDGEDEQFLKLWGMGSNIVDLSLTNCINLTDRGILGDNPLDATILKLQYLRKFAIINLDVNNGDVNITELSFIHAFRHMRLKSFHFFDRNLLINGKSISLTAIESLWNGAFGSTIEEVVLQETDLENCDMIMGMIAGGTEKRQQKCKSRDQIFGHNASVGSNSSSSTHNQGCAIM